MHLKLEDGGKKRKIVFEFGQKVQGEIKMNKIELLNYWLNLTKFDENQTSFNIFSNDWEFNDKNKKLIKSI